MSHTDYLADAAEGRAMPDTHRRRTVADAALIDRLASDYGIDVVELTFLGGELDRNHRVTAASGERYLAKQQARRNGGRAELWREDILEHLATRRLDIAVPRIVPTARGARHAAADETGDVLTVFNWVSGTEWARVEHRSESLLARLGAAAARITDALEGFDAAALPSTHHWDLARSRVAITSCVDEDAALAEKHYVPKALRWFDAIAPQLADLPRAVVHHDLNDNNVLVDVGNDTIAGVLDFNDALHSIRVAEPAIAGAYAMLRTPDPLIALGHVVAGYHSVTPLTEDELAVVYPLAAVRLCVQTLTWTVRGATSPTSYGSMRMRHTLPTLETVLTVDPVDAADHLRSMTGAGVTATSREH
jgi:hydroxylysine kinase